MTEPPVVWAAFLLHRAAHGHLPLYLLERSNYGDMIKRSKRHKDRRICQPCVSSDTYDRLRILRNELQFLDKGGHHTCRTVARAGTCFLMGNGSGRMPGVAALQPARFALGLSAYVSDDPRPAFFLVQCAFRCSDRAHGSWQLPFDGIQMNGKPSRARTAATLLNLALV